MGSKDVPRYIIIDSVVLISASLREAEPLLRPCVCTSAHNHVLSQQGCLRQEGIPLQPRCARPLGNGREAQMELLADAPHRPCGDFQYLRCQRICAISAPQGQWCGWWVRGVCAHRLFKSASRRCKRQIHEVKFITKSLTLCRSFRPLSCPGRLDGHSQHNLGSWPSGFLLGLANGKP